MSRHYFGWDLGGAHLKVAKLGADGRILAVRQIACPLWRGVGELARACALIDFPIAEADAMHAVTMTGELCDIFAGRAEGVRQILARFLPLLHPAADVRIYAGYAGWLEPAAAVGSGALAVASANWLALGAFAAELIEDGILIDVGSTTTDIIPIIGGEVQCAGRDDASRLACEELVYTGVIRTAVIAVCRTVPMDGHWQPLAAENFATMGDVYRLLGEIGEQHDLMPTADGRSKDVLGSARRLARMLGRDHEASDVAPMVEVARYIAGEQRARLARAVSLLCSRAPAHNHGRLLVGAGVGRFVVEHLARAGGAGYRAFDALVSGTVAGDEGLAIAAPAVAAAKLAWMTA